MTIGEGKMRNIILLSVITVCLFTGFVSADTFGTGANQFEIDFVTISGDASSANGTWIGENEDGGFEFFSNPSHDYRMATFEVTNGQWDKFKAINGSITGSPSSAYDHNTYFTGTDVPTTGISWYEAAQFVNWLNTSTGHQAAYKFTGTQGTANYTLTTWSTSEASGGTNLYRHKGAIYFLPTEDEWVKAAYWNGVTLQSYATIGDTLPISGIDTNYQSSSLWNVGSGSQEVNGTFDMMGNVWEYTESPSISGNYLPDTSRSTRGGSFADSSFFLSSIGRDYYHAFNESSTVGFRVASVIPEPTTLSLLAIGAFFAGRRRK